MKKTSPADLVFGILSIVAGLMSLCGGGIRLIRPESGVAPEVFSPVFENGALRAALYSSVVIWIALALVAVAAGAAMLAGHRLARPLGLVYAWGCVGAAILVLLLCAMEIVPVLSEASMSGIDMARIALSAPLTGCCPTAWAIVLLAFLYSRPAAATATVTSG